MRKFIHDASDLVRIAAITVLADWADAESLPAMQEAAAFQIYSFALPSAFQRLRMAGNNAHAALNVTFFAAGCFESSGWRIPSITSA
ncbi:MAG TPA: hypothetical protein VGP72_31365 [Planctomycetota bacterium]|jgi:hypothetical protein